MLTFVTIDFDDSLYACLQFTKENRANKTTSVHPCILDLLYQSVATAVPPLLLPCLHLPST